MVDDMVVFMISDDTATLADWMNACRSWLGVPELRSDDALVCVCIHVWVCRMLDDLALPQ